MASTMMLVPAKVHRNLVALTKGRPSDSLTFHGRQPSRTWPDSIQARKKNVLRKQAYACHGWRSINARSPVAKRVRATGVVQTGQLHRKTVGIDTDRDYLVVGFLDTACPNVTVTEYPQTSQGHQRLAMRCAAFGAEKVVIESSGQYHLAAYDALRKAGLDVICVNPLSVKALLRVEGKSDKRDAATLARIAASFGVRRSNMPDSEQRELRTFFRVMDSALQQRTRLTNRLNAQLTMAGCTIMKRVSGHTQRLMLEAIAQGAAMEAVADLHPQKKRRPLIRECLPEKDLSYDLRWYTRVLLEEAAVCERRRIEAEQILLSMSPMFEPELSLLLSVPFTDRLLALRVIAEMGRDCQKRYRSRRSFSAGCGTAPSSSVSGGKLLKTETRHGSHRLTNHVTNRLKGVMLGADFKASPLGQKIIAYRSRTGFAKALLAAAHEMSDAWYVVLKYREPYDWARIHPETNAGCE